MAKRCAKHKNITVFIDQSTAKTIADTTDTRRSIRQCDRPFDRVRPDVISFNYTISRRPIVAYAGV